MCSCSYLFQDFKWKLLSELGCSELPRKPGVYVLRLVEYPGFNRAKIVEKAVEFLQDIIEKSNWPELQRYLRSRVRRVKRVLNPNCPVLYIGSTEKLSSRCRDLAGKRHTAFTMILALVLSGAVVELGYVEVESGDQARRLEEDLKAKYRNIHGILPPLVEKLRTLQSLSTFTRYVLMC